MDTLTHIVLGACIGEAIAGRQLGKKALLLGALAQNIPDIDFVASCWLPTTSDLLAHRGFTHSFLFTLIVTPLLAVLSAKWYKGKASMSTRRWMLFWGLQIFIHQFIDAFNAYGTGWFEPFSHYRVSFNTIFVADPLFAIGPAIALVMLLILKVSSNKRTLWVKIGLGSCSLYLLFSIVFKLSIDNMVSNDLKTNHIASNWYFSTPTPLNNLLWYVVAQNDSGYYAGYRSILDKNSTVSFHYVYKNDSLLKPVTDKADLDRLERFSRGYYAVTMQHDTLVFNDLLFGKINGWNDPHPDFVFYYYLQYPDDNKLIVQRGRFAKWDKHTLGSFLERIRGNTN